MQLCSGGSVVSTPWGLQFLVRALHVLAPMTRTKTHLLATTLLLATMAAGCRTFEDDTVTSEESAVAEESALVEGTPEAYGVLDLLNDPAVTFEILDDLVRLDRRAAENLIAHRDGSDGAPGGGDDDLFDDIDEVDAVPYVGPSALDKLLAYAAAQGYVASGGDLLGVFDDVAFTVDEAEATVALVNSASYAELDEDVALDRRAVDSIMQARSIESVLELSSLYYVGQSAMLALREYPKTVAGTTPDGEPCDAHAECAGGLCAGLQMPYSSHGWCSPSWMADTFVSTADVTISDDGSPAVSTIAVGGLATVPMDVIVDLDIDHPRKQDLVVILHQPGGADALLWNHQVEPPTHFETPSGLEGDNMVNGDWVLEIRDTVSGQSGSLRGWSMWISSRYD